MEAFELGSQDLSHCVISILIGNIIVASI